MKPKLLETSLSKLSNKQKDITKLFPDFFKKVEKVKQKGGIQILSLSPQRWIFEVASGTIDGKKYKIAFQIDSIISQLVRHIVNPRNWTPDKEHADLRKVARSILFDADVKVACSCPAAQYWGPNYTLTKLKAKYGRKESRPPKVRNPREYGALCKHLQVLLDELPSYLTTLANWLKKNYAASIRRIEQEVKKREKLEPDTQNEAVVLVQHLDHLLE